MSTARGIHRSNTVLTDDTLLARGKQADVESHGVHCGLCRQLEYLPVPCPCSLQLCSDCAQQHQPQCKDFLNAAAAAVRMKNRLAPHCPACDATLRTPKVGFNCEDQEWAAAIHKRVGDHLASGCVDFIFSNGNGGGAHAAAATTTTAFSSSSSLSSKSSKSKSKLKLKGPRCTAKGCKTKLIGINAQVSCHDCAQAYCLRHRFASDHDCKGSAAAAAAAAAASKQQQQKKKSKKKSAGTDASTTAVPSTCSSAAAAGTPWGAAAAQRRQHQHAHTLNQPV